MSSVKRSYNVLIYIILAKILITEQVQVGCQFAAITSFYLIFLKKTSICKILLLGNAVILKINAIKNHPLVFLSGSITHSPHNVVVISMWFLYTSQSVGYVICIQQTVFVVLGFMAQCLRPWFLSQSIWWSCVVARGGSPGVESAEGELASFLEMTR